MVFDSAVFCRHTCLMCMSITYVRPLPVVELGVCQEILLLLIECMRMIWSSYPRRRQAKELLCVCEEFSNSHDVVCNSKKCSVLICRNKAMAHPAPPVFTVNCSILLSNLTR